MTIDFQFARWFRQKRRWSRSLSRLANLDIGLLTKPSKMRLYATSSTLTILKSPRSAF